jgi:hypothetical protein
MEKNKTQNVRNPKTSIFLPGENFRTLFRTKFRREVNSLDMFKQLPDKAHLR